MKSILLIDEDNKFSVRLETALAAEGYQVHHESSIEMATERAKDTQFDLVICERVFSGLSGMEGMTLLKYLQPQIGFVILTAFSTIESAVDAIKKGADDYLAKPVDMANLLVTIRAILQHKATKSLREERNDDKIFNALANPIRRLVLKQLKQYERVKFMELCRLAEIDDHTKFNFHLRQLTACGLVKKLNQKEYTLTSLGRSLTASPLFS